MGAIIFFIIHRFEMKSQAKASGAVFEFSADLKMKQGNRDLTEDEWIPLVKKWFMEKKSGFKDKVKIAISDKYVAKSANELFIDLAGCGISELEVVLLGRENEIGAIIATPSSERYSAIWNLSAEQLEIFRQGKSGIRQISTGKAGTVAIRQVFLHKGGGEELVKMVTKGDLVVIIVKNNVPISELLLVVKLIEENTGFVPLFLLEGKHYIKGWYE